MTVTIVAILVPLLLMIGTVGLQIYLSKKQNKWLGLMLPLICFMFSIMSVLSLSMFTTMSSAVSVETVDGVVVNQETIEAQTKRPSIGEMAAMAPPVFFTTNIPTVILAAIYGACREGRKKNLELQKMNIQDL